MKKMKKGLALVLALYMLLGGTALSTENAVEYTTETMTDATTEPTTETVMDETTEPTTETVTEATTEPTTETVTDGATEPTTETMTDATTEASTEPTTAEKTKLMRPLENEQETMSSEETQPSYTVSIPSDINLNQEKGITVTISGGSGLNGSKIVVSVSSANDFKMVFDGNSIPYHLDRTELEFTEAGQQTIAITVNPEDGLPSGSYTDILTFTYSVSAGE